MLTSSTYGVLARQGNIPMTSTVLMDEHQCMSEERDAAVVLDSAVTCQWWMSWFWCISPLLLARIWANLLRFCFLKLFSLIHFTTLIQKQSEHPHVSTTFTIIVVVVVFFKCNKNTRKLWPEQFEKYAHFIGFVIFYGLLALFESLGSSNCTEAGDGSLDSLSRCLHAWAPCHIDTYLFSVRFRRL